MQCDNLKKQVSYLEEKVNKNTEDVEKIEYLNEQLKFVYNISYISYQNQKIVYAQALFLRTNYFMSLTLPLKRKIER